MSSVAPHGQVVWDQGSTLQQVFTTVKGQNEKSRSSVQAMRDVPPESGEVVPAAALS